MNAFLLTQAITILARLLLESGVFERVLKSVTEWNTKKLTGAEKRHGVLDELQVAGLKLSDSTVRLAIELAVAFTKAKAGV
jgi:hypothetical protein